MVPDWELWACAAHVERQHGERAPFLLRSASARWRWQAILTVSKLGRLLQLASLDCGAACAIAVFNRF